MTCMQCCRMRAQIASEGAEIYNLARKLAKGGPANLLIEVNRRKEVLAENRRWFADHKTREHGMELVK